MHWLFAYIFFLEFTINLASINIVSWPQICLNVPKFYLKWNNVEKYGKLTSSGNLFFKSERTVKKIYVTKFVYIWSEKIIYNKTAIQLRKNGIQRGNNSRNRVNCQLVTLPWRKVRKIQKFAVITIRKFQNKKCSERNVISKSCIKVESQDDNCVRSCEKPWLGFLLLSSENTDNWRGNIFGFMGSKVRHEEGTCNKTNSKWRTKDLKEARKTIEESCSATINLLIFSIQEPFKCIWLTLTAKLFNLIIKLIENYKIALDHFKMSQSLYFSSFQVIASCK